jgi:hypothetical protein
MLEGHVETIEQRNARVEADKAWETSWVRRGLIAGITYICAVVLLTVLGHDGAWKHATVPVMGYLLSTLSLPVAKKMWLRRRNHASALKILGCLVVFFLMAMPPARAGVPVLQIGDIALANQDIVSWSVDMHSGMPFLDIEFDQTDGEAMGKMTAAKVGQSIKIIVCGQVAAEPVIREAIHGDSAYFSLHENYDDQIACLDTSKKTSP